MRKLNIKKFVIVALILVLVCPLFLFGCGEKKPDPTKKYVVFNDGNGKEYTVVGWNTVDVHVPYDDSKVYRFTYEVYYRDNDQTTGEAGNFPVFEGTETGNHWLKAKVSEGPGTSLKDYTLKFIIDEKPDTRVEPEIRFDPRGAIEFIENERYVYKYDESLPQTYPKLELYFKGQKIELADENDNYIYSCENEQGIVSQRPFVVGVYKVNYIIAKMDFKQEDQDKFKPVNITITVEIRE